jgi:trk system potassium uptake protein TrkA
VAATGEDEDNLVISLLAKRQFDVPRIAARINDDENTWLFDARCGVDVAVPSAAPLISLVEEAADVTDTVSLLRLVKAGVNIIETVIGPESKAAHLRVGAVPLPAGSVVAAVIRAGRPVVPDASYELQVGDELIIVTQAASEREIHNAFQ